MSDALNKALSDLDPANDEHWTDDGLPRVDAVQVIAEDESIDREAISKAAPNLTRKGDSNPAPAEGGVVDSTNPTLGENSSPAVVINNSTDPAPEPNAATETPQAEAVELTPLEQAKLRLEQVAEAMNDLCASRERITDEINKATAEYEHLSRFVEQNKPVNSDQDNINRYFATQDQTRQRRAATAQEIRKLGLKPADVLGKSPADLAIAQRTTQQRALNARS